MIEFELVVDDSKEGISPGAPRGPTLFRSGL